MNYIRELSHFETLISDDVGGKAFALNRLIHAGFNVPPGFVVIRQAFDDFLAANNFLDTILRALQSASLEDAGVLEQIAASIQGTIMSGRMPSNIRLELEQAFAALGVEAVAVRSSSTREDGHSSSWAGQLETYLGTRADNLLINVMRCWASLFSARAISYAADKGLKPGDSHIAVIVQAMVPSVVSGTSFSVHPVTEDVNNIVVEAGLGLGEAVVAGQITPDTYVITKTHFDIVERRVSKQDRALYLAPEGGTVWRPLTGDQVGREKLTELDVIEVARLTAAIEAQFGFPVDVEWAKADTRLHVLQSRPITTLTAQVRPPRAPRLYDGERNWVHRLTREVGLFGASLWYLWHPSELAKQMLGATMTDALFIEIEPNVVKRYRVKEQLDLSEEAFDRLVRERPDVLREYLVKASDLNAKAEAMIAKGADAFDEFKAAIDFFILHGLHATVIPDGTMRAIERVGTDSAGCRALAEELRKTSLYHDLISQVLYPLARRRLAALGVGDSDSQVELLTAAEVIDGAIGVLSSRSTERRAGKLFVYENLDGRESVHWITNTLPIIAALEHIPTPRSGELPTLQGTPAYPGTARGRARVVVASHLDGVTFENGDVLVAYDTTPQLGPLVVKCSAIVTNEGGINCHAATIAREYRKPCVVGTGYATHVIKSGDFLDVDADTGTVSVLGRSSQGRQDGTCDFGRPANPQSTAGIP